MGSSISKQTIDGYLEEYSAAHDVTPNDAVKTSMAKEFMEYADVRDTAIYNNEKGVRN